MVNVSELDFLVEIKQTLFPDVSTAGRESVRLRSRPVMTKVKKVHACAYMLAHVNRLIHNGFPDEQKNLWIYKKVRNEITYANCAQYEVCGYCPFDALQRCGAEALNKAIDLALLEAKSEPQRTVTFEDVCPVNNVSFASLLNRRRRQEDRWFFTSDLVNYSPKLIEDSCDVRKCPSIIGCGVFDGHGGPEASEHCANLAPFLLSRKLRRRFLEICENRSTETIPDILASVVSELNFSVNEYHRQALWNSGTTATICVIFGRYVYTAWVGDSQAVVYSPEVKRKADPVTEEPNCTVLNGTLKLRGDSERKRVSTLLEPEIQYLSLQPVCEVPNSHVSTQPLNVNGQLQEYSNVPPAFNQKAVLTDKLHRPEQAEEFVSVLRAGGCVTFKSNLPEQSPASSTCSSDNERPVSCLSSLLAVPPPLMSNAAFLRAPPNLNTPGTYRVGGLSGVVRAIGAESNSIAGMSQLPSISIFHLPISSPACLIIASDGLWDTSDCSVNDCAHLIQAPGLKSPTSGVSHRELAKFLANRAACNGSTDNITVLVVWLEGSKASPNVLPEVSFARARHPRASRCLSALICPRQEDTSPSRSLSTDICLIGGAFGLQEVLISSPLHSVYLQ